MVIAFAISDLVGKDTSEERHKVNAGKEDRVDLSGYCSAETELRLKEEEEDGQHRVIAEALTGVGERKGKESFWLTFEHIFIV